MLYVTGTTLNIQSFIGAIMAVGVAMANAILLVTFAEHRRRAGEAGEEGKGEGRGGEGVECVERREPHLKGRIRVVALAVSSRTECRKGYRFLKCILNMSISK